MKLFVVYLDEKFSYSVLIVSFRDAILSKSRPQYDIYCNIEKKILWSYEENKVQEAEIKSSRNLTVVL